LRGSCVAVFTARVAAQIFSSNQKLARILRAKSSRLAQILALWRCQILPVAQILGTAFLLLNFLWGGAERRCGSVSDPHRRAAGWVGAMWRRFAPTRATIPPPRRNRMNTGFRATTAARRTSPARGAIIAAETKASRGCWRNDPRSGAGAKPKTERRTGAEIAEIRSDSVSSRQNRWAAMRRRASG